MKKRILSLLSVIVLTSVMLFSCNTGGTGDAQGSEGVIYDSSTPVAIVMNSSQNQTVNEAVAMLRSGISGKVPSTPELIAPADPERAHEIVIGKSDRAVSVEAYKRLERMRMEIEEELEGCPRFLIYSNGSSVAVAYDEHEDDIALISAVNHFIENYITDSLSLKDATVYREVVDIDAYYQAIDDALLEKKWAELANKVGGELGDDIVSAFKTLYTLYSDDLISWYANLYEPNICVCDGECQNTQYCGGGGFYYSNSARNTDGYLPDAESTEQALRFIDDSGMIDTIAPKGYEDALPAEMGEALVKFVYNLQDPNGYFYHPQWSKAAVDYRVSRRSRDLGHCVSILSNYGLKPKYSTPTGVEGEDLDAVSYKHLTSRLGQSAVNAVSKVIFTSDSKVAVDPKLQNKDTFLAWLDSLDVQNKSYSAGNTLTSFFSDIKYRDETLKKEGAGYSLVEILVDYLNEKQFSHNGLWGYETNYYTVNGLMKISGVYSKSGSQLPNADKALQAAIDAITSDEVPDAVTDIYNTWYAVNRVFGLINAYNGEEGKALVNAQRQKLLESAPYAIEVTAKKLAAFLKPDGSFSYGVQYSAATSQGMPVAIPNSYEGDVNGTLICTSDILNYIYSALGLASFRVPIYTYNDWRHYLSIIENLGVVIKDTEEPIYDPITFDNDEDGGSPVHDDLVVEERSKDYGGGATVIADPRPGAEGNVLKITSIAGTSESVTVSSPNLSNAFSCFVFESDMCLLSSDTNFPIRITMGGCYIVSLKIADGRIRFVESSSETSSKSKDVILGELPAVGEWFRIKIEYYKGDHDSVRIKFYYDGDLTDNKDVELISVSDNYLDNEGEKFIEGTGNPSLQYSDTNLWFMKGYNIEFLMDNVASYKTEDKYEKYTDRRNPLAINVDAPATADGDDGSSTPSYTNTYYNLSDIAGTRYDYSQKLSKSYIYNKSYDADTQASTVSVPVITDIMGGKLKVANLPNWAGFAIANTASNKSGSLGAKYIFETDFIWTGGKQSEGSGAAAYIGFLGKHNAVDNNYMFSSISVSFSETDPGVLIFGNTELEKGRAYNIRIEYEVGGSLALYVDNVVSLTGAVAKGASSDNLTYEAFGMYMRKNFVDPFSFTMDNTFLGIVYPEDAGDIPIVPIDPYAPPEDAGLPEGLETLYGNSENEGTRHDFENSADYGTNVLYNKADNTASASSIAKVEDGLLKIDSMGTAWSGFAIANTGNTAGGTDYTYVFEANLRWTSGSQAAAQHAKGAAFLGFLGEHAAVDNNNFSSWIYVSFDGCDENQMKIGGAVLNRGTTYNIRLEYTVGGDTKLYINGEAVAGVTSTKGASSDTSTYQAFGMYVRRDISPDLEFTLDNVYMGIQEPKVIVDPGVPEGLETYYNGSLTGAAEGAKYDFTDSADYGTGVFYDKKDGTVTAPKFASVKDGVMYFSHLDSEKNNNTRYQGFALASGLDGTYETGTTYVFETDFKWVGGTQDSSQIAKYAAYIGLLGSHEAVDNVYMSYAIKVSLIDGDSSAILFGNARLERGITYNIRIEAVTGTGLKLYVNGVEAETGTVWNGASSDAATYAGFGWYSRRSFDPAFEFTMDNVYMGVIPPSASEPTEPETVTVLSTPTGAEGIVVIMHDDGTLDTMSIIDNVFEEYGLRGNVALLGNKIYTVSEDGTGVYNTSNIAKWQAYLDTGRWQISSHSMTHAFWGLTDKAEVVYDVDGTTVLATITEDGMITYEVVTSQEILRTAFPSQRVLTFAYPGFWAQRSLGTDRFSAVARALVANTYIAGRDAYGNANIDLSDTSVDWKFSPSYQFDSTNVSDILAAINNTQNGDMAVLFTHKVVSDDTETLGSNEMYESDLRTIAARVAELQSNGKVWCAFYEDAVLYTREAQAANLSFTESENEITVNLTIPGLDNSIYNYPLTVRVIVPDTWEAAKIVQGESETYARITVENGICYIDAEIIPDGGEVTITPVSADDPSLPEEEPTVPDIDTPIVSDDEDAPNIGDIDTDEWYNK